MELALKKPIKIIEKLFHPKERLPEKNADTVQLYIVRRCRLYLRRNPITRILKTKSQEVLCDLFQKLHAVKI